MARVLRNQQYLDQSDEMSSVKCPERTCAPSSIRLLEQFNNKDKTATPSNVDELLSLLPASFQSESGDIVPSSVDVQACMERELDIRRLTQVHGLLWMAGSAMPPRALHNQVLLRREIIITERMDMHLIWTSGMIFLKPIPLFLLDPLFWTKYIGCGQATCCAPESIIDASTSCGCQHRNLWKCALGFLFSYAGLIRHHSDFLLAKEKCLLPKEIHWDSWMAFIREIEPEHIYLRIDPRFHYGELRLSRLNTIYRLSQTPLTGYMARWDQYATFFHDNLAWFAAATVYMVVVLTAMQVGLATDRLASDTNFQVAPYSFTIFSIVCPLVYMVLMSTLFCVIFFFNWVKALSKRNYRVRHMTQ